jgi:hypothetical protein
MLVFAPSAICRHLRKVMVKRSRHPLSQVRTGNPNSQDNRGQQNYMHGRVNHVIAEEAQGDKDVVLGTFLINNFI